MPETKGHYIYKYVHGGEIIYVGKTDAYLSSRIYNHTRQEKFQPFLSECRIYFFQCNNTAETTIWECYLINKYKPALNVSMKCDDKIDIRMKEPEWTEYRNKLPTISKKCRDSKSKVGEEHYKKYVRRDQIAKRIGILESMSNNIQQISQSELDQAIAQGIQRDVNMLKKVELDFINNGTLKVFDAKGMFEQLTLDLGIVCEDNTVQVARVKKHRKRG